MIRVIYEHNENGDRDGDDGIVETGSWDSDTYTDKQITDEITSDSTDNADGRSQ
jgi:hypothetical protein